ncbi:unnamed protein product [Caenorhabditis bovis]|uniref:Transmembrane protein 164 n=1 Tax=Caenorhabditis bovis TaxID=2654633 RepID=A0A8S1FFF5_9PELO|nr:unnamed protein product [Caenorhabditis bovis]
MLGVIRELAIGGIDSSIQGNGGEECMNYLPGWQRFLESVIFIPLSLYSAYISLPLDCSFRFPPKTISRYTILLAYSLIFGAELAYKMISSTGVFLLNPCHVTTTMQLILLTMEGKSKFACFLFRLMLYFMPGAWFALAFPILNTRNLPGEVFIYYAQHIAILIVPVYLMYIQGSFEPEKSHDFAWTVFGVSVFSLYHFVVLQCGAMMTRVNLNNIMCPAVSDPFQSRAYRVIAVGHQCILIPILSKTYSAMSLAVVDFIRSFYETDLHPRNVCKIVEPPPSLPPSVEQKKTC